MAASTEKKSPIKDPPLRTAGHSIRLQMIDVVFNKMLAPVWAAGMLGLAAVYAWFMYFIPSLSNAILITALAGAAIVWAIIRNCRVKSEIERLSQGMKGEQAVGQLLEELREDGYRVFHDLVEDGFNIDHVLVGPGGVLAIETKTISKPTDGDGRVVFDGEKVTVAGRVHDRDPIAQAQANARRISEIIRSMTSRNVQVRPVVLYPGWWVEAPSGQETWVLNPKRLFSYLRNEPTKLSPEDIALIANRLTLHVRGRAQTS